MEDYFALPATQTQEEYVESSQSSTQDLAITAPWGRLTSCSPTLLSVDLFECQYTCGRSKECDIVIENSHCAQFLNVSKEHFKITKDEEIAYVTDLSKNGTFINKHKIGKGKRLILNTSDVIALGDPSSKVFMFGSNLKTEEHFLPRELQKFYFVTKLLGRGACGEVRFALEKTTCDPYAIKKIHKGQTGNKYTLNHPQKIKTEIEILKNVTHPFIINMRQVVETETEVFLVLEYMNGGDLGSRIATSSLSESEIKFIFYQMLVAVQYLHQQGITHRDLKPENVLLSEGSFPKVKISDFGLSKLMNEVSLMTTICGTISYVAPEILGSAQYKKEVDVWSLGVILFYMFSKSLPFMGAERETVAGNILRGKFNFDAKFWKGVSATAKDLIKKMLVVDQEKRISMDQIFRHPWIEKDVGMQYRVNKLIVNDEDSEEESSLVVAPKRQRLC